MDANYMIRMAEIRGLFGSPTNTRPSHAERARRRKEREAEEARAKTAASGDHRRGAFCLERICAPTRAWLERILEDKEACPRYFSLYRPHSQSDILTDVPLETCFLDVFMGLKTQFGFSSDFNKTISI